MLLRFLLYITKPANQQLKSKKRGRFVSLKIWTYQFLLKRLLRTYLRYAISDTIVMDHIKIVHEYRDLAFESELIRNKISYKSEMVKHSFPLHTLKGRTTRHFSYFRFNDLLTLYIDGKEFCIRHDNKFSIDGTIKGNIKYSSKDNCLSQSTIEISPSIRQVEVFENSGAKGINSQKNNRANNKQPRTNKPSQNIFGRDTNITSIIAIKKHNESKEMPPPQSIEKKGFKIDTSF